MNKLTKLLIDNAEKEYRLFTMRCTPDAKRDFLGVRLGKIKQIAKENFKDKKLVQKFYSLDHEFTEEWFLHGYFISLEKDFSKVSNLLPHFIKNIDNWAVCDSVCCAMKIFKKRAGEVFDLVKYWLASDDVYEVRFGIVTLLSHYVKDFPDEILRLTLSVSSSEYMINMALAWLYSVMLVYHKDKIIALLKNNALPLFVHNKTIQKARESFRLTKELKAELLKLKR